MELGEEVVAGDGGEGGEQPRVEEAEHLPEDVGAAVDEEVPLRVPLGAHPVQRVVLHHPHQHVVREHPHPPGPRLHRHLLPPQRRQRGHEPLAPHVQLHQQPSQLFLLFCRCGHSIPGCPRSSWFVGQNLSA